MKIQKTQVKIIQLKRKKTEEVIQKIPLQIDIIQENQVVELKFLLLENLIMTLILLLKK